MPSRIIVSISNMYWSLYVLNTLHMLKVCKYLGLHYLDGAIQVKFTYRDKLSVGFLDAVHIRGPHLTQCLHPIATETKAYLNIVYFKQTRDNLSAYDPIGIQSTYGTL